MRLTHIIQCVAWVAALLAAVMVVPVGGLFIGLLTPLPFVYYLFELPVRYAAQFAAVVVGVVFMGAIALGIGKLGIFALEFGVLGVWLAQAFRRGYTVGRVISLGTALLVGVGLVAVIISAIMKDMNPISMVESYITANLNVSLQAYQSMGLPADKAAEMKTYAELVRRAIVRVYPSLMIVGSAFVVRLNVILSLRLFSSKGVPDPKGWKLSLWKAPEQLVWGVIISGFSLFLPLQGVKFVALNMLIIFMAIYLFQGMSILAYFFDRFRVPLWAKVVIYFLIGIQQICLVVLALAGLFDQWINFRRVGTKAAM